MAWFGKKESINNNMTNEYKYEEVDFGFTAVDGDELKQITATPVEVTEKLDASASEIKELSEKVSELVELQTDIMSELVSAKQIYAEKSSSSDVTKEMIEGVQLLSEVDCFDLCDILRLHLTTYYDYPINAHVMKDGTGDLFGCICSN